MKYNKLSKKFNLLLGLTDRYYLAIVIGLLSVTCNHYSYANPPQSFPSKEIFLPNWGLIHPSQMKHLSLGILHKKDGDEIVIYDIRKYKPTINYPKESRSRLPSFEGDYFLVSHFYRGNINSLGGYFNGFSKPPSTSAVSISNTTDDRPALTYHFENKSPGFSGFWIHFFDFKKPPSKQLFLNATPFTYLSFLLRGEKGNEKIMLRMADRSMIKNEDSFLIGDVSSFLPQGKVKTDWQTAWVPLSLLGTHVNRKELANVVFQAAENASGRIFVRDLAFTKKKGVTIPSAKNDRFPPCLSNRAMWIWETEKITKSPKEQQLLLDFSKKYHITDLFIQIPYQTERIEADWKVVWDPKRIRPLLAKLNQAGIRVYALDGDPRFALKELHGRSIRLIEQIAQYNQTVLPKERFYGIRYDNEPYLLPNFGGIHKEIILKEYLELIKKSQTLARKAGLTFGVDIPFWFDSLNEFFESAANLEGRPMSERIIDMVDNVGVMDYRTIAYGADGVIEHGANELKYAAKKGKKVFIGLETVKLPDETIYDFGPKGEGSHLLIKPISSQKVRITFIPKGKRIDSHEGILRHQTRQVQVPSSKLTFNQKTLADLEEVMRNSEKEFCRFSSFQGFAIHSYESYRPWLDEQKLSIRVLK